MPVMAVGYSCDCKDVEIQSTMRISCFMKSMLSGILSITSPSWAGLELNSDLQSEERATNYVSHVTASLGYLADDTCQVRRGADWDADFNAHTGTVGLASG